ncbi:MAG: hypothetical protein J7M40_14320 [Planctomycetes bacterium]|nr:hypothetical protein [Planctomycetota bacterium]
MDRQVYILGELLGPDDPQVRAIRQLGSVDAPAASALMRNLALQRGIDTDAPPAFGFADRLDTGHLLLGRIRVGDILCQKTGLADKGRRPGHTAILGRSDSGKSFLTKHIAVQAIREGETVLVLARDREWRDILPMFPPEKLLYIEPGDLGINVLEVPRSADGKPVMPPEEWVMNLKTVTRSTLFLRDVASNMFSDTLLDLYAKNNIANGGDYPCLSRLRDAVVNMPMKGKRLSEARDTLINRLDMLIRFLGGLDVIRSRDLHKLFGHSVILDMSGLEEIPCTFLFEFLTVLLRAVFPAEDEQ